MPTAPKPVEQQHAKVEHLEAPAPLLGEPVLILGAVVAVADAVLATVPSLPDWLQAGLIAIVTAGGALGIRRKVTPGG